MATTNERLGIVETKVENLNEKLDDLKSDVTETREELKDQLKTMYDASCTQHAELAKKISGLEKIRERTMWMVAGAVAFAGIISGHFEKILAFFH
jgi:peptidoglycan hydrolase CwlO-like protein